jgi:hypothetical protein
LKLGCGGLVYFYSLYFRTFSSNASSIVLLIEQAGTGCDSLSLRATAVYFIQGMAIFYPSPIDILLFSFGSVKKRSTGDLEHKAKSLQVLQG